MFWTTLLVLLILWLLGLVLEVGAGVHVLGVLAALLLLYRLTIGSRRR